MSALSIVIGAAAGVAVVVGAAVYAKRKKASAKGGIDADKVAKGLLNNIPTEHVDTLAMKDIVFYFKNLRLKQGEHIPFIAKAEAFKTSLQGLVLAVYNEKTDRIEHVKNIVAKNVEQQVLEVLGNEPLVVLT
ncbi:MAG: hypothetical protein ACI4AM_03735 [Muribaculaceae bacterium]